MLDEKQTIIERENNTVFLSLNDDPTSLKPIGFAVARWIKDFDKIEILEADLLKFDPEKIEKYIARFAELNTLAISQAWCDESTIALMNPTQWKRIVLRRCKRLDQIQIRIVRALQSKIAGNRLIVAANLDLNPISLLSQFDAKADAIAGCVEALQNRKEYLQNLQSQVLNPLPEIWGGGRNVRS